jgi:hypothetical protein
METFFRFVRTPKSLKRSFIEMFVFLGPFLTLCMASAQESRFEFKIQSLTPLTPPAEAHLSPNHLNEKTNFLRKNNIAFSLNWQRRLKEKFETTHSSGGGVVDGGGGNINSNTDQLLELSNTENTSPAPLIHLKNTVENVFGPRFDSIERQLPSFRNWIFAGFENGMVWALDRGEFKSPICQNFQINTTPQSIVACQSFKRVHLKESWYKRTSEIDLAQMVVHELVRFHGIRLAREHGLAKDIQDETVALVTQAILDSNRNGKMLYDLLVEYHLLLGETEVQQRQLTVATSTIETIAMAYKGISDIIRTCQTSQESAKALGSRLRTTYFNLVDAISSAQKICQSLFFRGDSWLPSQCLEDKGPELNLLFSKNCSI